MPQTIEGIKGKDLLRLGSLRAQASIEPEQIYYVTLYTEDERRTGKQELLRRIKTCRQQAKENDMTPEDLDDILGEKVSHTF